ncbi:MAG TPA: glycosyltransferase family 4 protein [Pirellulales bacterium]|nr:glycosyltransferase family 4 protein [Pirellulales bacterium]
MPKTLNYHTRHAAHCAHHRGKLPAVASALAGRPRAPKVVLAGKLTGWLAPGGGETQMQALAGALGETGVEARFWRPWEDRLTDVDCLHLFGSEPEHLPLALAARRAKVPVVLSTIAWFDLASCWREPWPLPRRLAACGKFAVRAAAPWLKSWRRELYHAVDRLLPNSQAEAAQLMRYFGVPADRICVVPNGADRRFAKGEARPFAQFAGCRRFVLYPGRIEPRKNQLGFLRAMQGVDAPIVILGDVVPGHESYLTACRRAAGPHVKFIGRIEHDDPLLASAYAAAACVVLASWYETPSLAALEAGMSGVPLVLPRGGCAHEYFGELAEYVSPGDLAEIREATLAALGRGRNLQLGALVRKNFSWQAAAEATREAYEKVV